MGEIVGEVSESAVRAARELRVVFSRLRRRLRETYDTSELTPSQISVLSRLDREGDASVSDLAVVERVRHQSMAATVAVLEERGLVSRRPDPDDGRRHLLSPSMAGRRFRDNGRRAGEEWLTRALEEQFTEVERQTMIEAIALLDKLAR